ncbi:hypothetical protein [Methylobacterium persicinum]|uniref:Transposase n=1 Tax=Methylobacterium persicinum TaxID=374426 RepID=A0ABU0HQD7_9HYPH|nr:hypothetical protein [Methylobacterium persicinum]MDQ0444547.1 hypothetical protein [Methylobacterium persicinum]GJE40443.1 hypothetical protein KHHGKMAE_4536 [Methylobacterium persicinum]
MPTRRFLPSMEFLAYAWFRVALAADTREVGRKAYFRFGGVPWRKQPGGFRPASIIAQV